MTDSSDQLLAHLRNGRGRDAGMTRAEISQAYDAIEFGDLKAIRALTLRLEQFPPLPGSDGLKPMRRLSQERPPPQEPVAAEFVAELSPDEAREKLRMFGVPWPMFLSDEHALALDSYTTGANDIGRAADKWADEHPGISALAKRSWKIHIDELTVVGKRDAEAKAAELLIRRKAVKMADAKELADRKLVAVKASSIKPKQTDWLWEGLIPNGFLSVIAGMPSVGKSTVAYDTIARLTRGHLEGELRGTPRSVGIISTEDDWASVIVPRLMAAEADLDMVVSIRADGDDGGISLPVDTEALRSQIVEHKLALVLIDALMSVMGKTDTHKDADARKALDPLNALASDEGMAFLGVMHVNKGNAKDPLDALMASRAFSAVPRSVMFCLKDPSNPGRSIITHAKCNVGRLMTSRQYTIEEQKLADPDGSSISYITTSRVLWGDEDQRSATDVLQETHKHGGQNKDEVSGVGLRILLWMTHHSSTEPGKQFTASEIKTALPDQEANTISQTLSRLVSNGKLTKVTRGIYSLFQTSNETDGSAGSDKQHDTK